MSLKPESSHSPERYKYVKLDPAKCKTHDKHRDQFEWPKKNVEIDYMRHSWVSGRMHW